MAFECSPITIEDRKKIFEEEVKGHIPEKLYQYLLDNGFLTQTASKGHHGCYAGGLFDHSIEVMRALLNLTEKLGLKWSVPERSPYLVGIGHDICKLYAYLLVNEKYVWNSNQKYQDKQHGIKSVLMLRDILGEEVLTDEEESCIAWHMGAFTDKEYWEYYSKGVDTFPNVLWTHTADMVASHIKKV